MSDVLVVDDEAALRRLVRRVVEREGAGVVEAGDAEQALLIAAQDPPKVAFCDVDLDSGPNGFWLAGELQRLYPATVVVMMTSNAEVDAVVTGVRAGVKIYLVKPVPPQRLRETLKAGLIEHAARLRRGSETA